MANSSMFSESVSNLENILLVLFVSKMYLISCIVQHSLRSDIANSSQPSESLRYSLLNSYSCSAMSRSSLLRVQARSTGSNPRCTSCRKDAAINTWLASARYLFKRYTAGPSFRQGASLNSVDNGTFLGSPMVNPCSRRSLTI